MMLWLNNFMQNRRLSYILQKYRERFHANFCPRCWLIRLGIVLTAIVIIWYLF